MATDFTQDTVLHFLQSSGGSVKNSDLLLHFRSYIRDSADRDRNRELFKKFVNSVATVQQLDGVSYVVLRKKFKGRVPGGVEGGYSGRPRTPAGKTTESLPESVRPTPAGSADKPRLREGTAPAPPGATAEKTILPAAGIVLNNNNNNVERNLNLKQQQVIRPEQSVRPAAAAAAAAQVSQTVPEKTDLKTPTLSKPSAQDQYTKVAQHRVAFCPPPEITPVVAAVSHQTSQQVPVPEIRRETPLLPEGGVYQEPNLHHISPQPLVATRRARHRKSYKSAVSYDEDEDEEEEVPMRPGSAGGEWPLSAPHGDAGRAVSTPSPCIIDQPAPPSVDSPSSSSERKLPQIYIQDIERETRPPGGSGWIPEPGVELRGWRAGPGMEPVSGPGRRSLPLEPEHYNVSPERAEEVAPKPDVPTNRRYSQPAGVHLGPRQSPDQSQSDWLLSDHSSVLSPSSDAGFSSSDRPPSGSHRGLGFNSSYEDLKDRRGKTWRGAEIEEVLQRSHRNNKTMAPWHHSTGNLYDDQEPTGRSSPFHQSPDRLHGNQHFVASVLPRHLSAGDLYDDREEAESSDGSTSSPPLRQRPAVARWVSSQLRNRMCRSMGADLDQLLQEEARGGGGGGGNEVARLNRLHMISSSLSLRYNLSSSSLSSCSTPPRCHSVTDLIEGVDGRGGRRSLPATPTSAPHHEGSGRQSLVPLEPREHDWLVKAAAGAWPDIYSLFREDSSLLNRRDFISGFTVLHWIAKHGDHRVLNTLWYGVQRAGLTFDTNSRSACGHTPLHIAAIHGNKNIIYLLVNKFNADVRLRDTAGKKPWQYLSRTASPEIFSLLGAPARAARGGQGGVGGVDTSWKPERQQQQHHHRRRRHHFSMASSGERPLTVAGTARVKRSTSIAALLKHKSMRRFHGHQSDSSV